MSAAKLDKVLIVGGGTAGWMTASVLLQTLGKHYEIALIESDQISTVGVGEATIPSLRSFHQLCGIDEDEFVRETQATFKLGIQFNNWGALGESYIHSFGKIGADTGLVDFVHYWLKMHGRGRATALADYSINLQACRHNKFSRASTDPKLAKSPWADIGHAFHFDAGRFASYLRRNCEKNGVKRTEGRIDSVQCDPATGFVTSITLANGDLHRADLFIDCSGFQGLLIEKTLHTGYEDWSHYLPCDSALAVPSEPVRPLLPYTRATAHTAGWQWRIPLQHRTGNGHVYCSRFMSQDEATAVLLKNLDSPPLADPRPIRFVTGRRKKFWNKNVVAIGLASGFMEPLESTSIHLIQTAILRLVQLFPNKAFEEADRDEYNRQSALEFELIRDFIILHYHATRRDDSAFWRQCRGMSIPENLRNKIALFRSNGRVFRFNNELFGDTGWLQVMLGQGIQPTGYDPLADNMANEVVEKMLANVKSVVAEVARRMPGHEDFIQQHCKAPPSA